MLLLAASQVGQALKSKPAGLCGDWPGALGCLHQRLVRDRGALECCALALPLRHALEQPPPRQCSFCWIILLSVTARPHALYHMHPPGRAWACPSGLVAACLLAQHAADSCRLPAVFKLDHAQAMMAIPHLQLRSLGSPAAIMLFVLNGAYRGLTDTRSAAWPPTSVQTPVWAVLLSASCLQLPATSPCYVLSSV